jgi:hypothetical protein
VAAPPVEVEGSGCVGLDLNLNLILKLAAKPPAFNCSKSIFPKQILPPFPV